MLMAQTVVDDNIPGLTYHIWTYS